MQYILQEIGISWIFLIFHQAGNAVNRTRRWIAHGTGHFTFSKSSPDSGRRRLKHPS
jgi:hypothetical protein